MNRICWWLVDQLSRMLESDEGNAVLGDFAESGVTGAEALWDLLGLVIRRQTALWKGWRPWLVLMGLVVPFSILLSLVCRGWAEGGAIYFCIYIDNWTWGYLGNSILRRDLANAVSSFFLDYSTLICWSWTIGFVLGSLSRRTVWVNGTLFCLVFFGEFLAVPQQHNPFNAAIFSVPFYSAVFPLALRAVLVLLPSLWGMHKAVKQTTLRPFRTILWAVAIAIMTMRAAQNLEASVIVGWLQSLGIPTWSPAASSLSRQLLGSWPLRLLVPLVMMCPVGYMAASASWQRWRGKSVSA